jgi:hypothetical protein
MPVGVGHVQRALLKVLERRSQRVSKDDAGLATKVVVSRAFAGRPYSESERVTALRSLRTMQARGLVEKTKVPGSPALWRAAAPKAEDAAV